MESAKLDGIDRGIAVFLLVVSVVFLLVSTATIVLFYRERNAFEIRARSAYLVMLTGLSFMAAVCKIMVNQSEGVFGHEKDVYIAKTVKYFATVCSTFCYGSRTVRLALLYSPRARKAAPWLLPEWHHVVVCILLGLAAMIAPIYDYFDRSASLDSQEQEAEFIERADNQLWAVSLACKVAVIAINPLTWYVDDIFKLGRELRFYTVLLLIQIVGGKAAEDQDLTVTRWIDNENLEFVSAVIMFSLSVIHPIKQRLLYPMQSSDPKEVEALRERKGTGIGGMGNGSFLWRSTAGGNRPSWTGKDSDSVTTTQVDDDETNMAGVVSATASPGSWTYERVVSMPEVSVAFEEFSRKALCQESLAFLKDVTTYQSQAFTSDDEEKGDGLSEDGDQVIEEQFALMSYVVREYILDGAPNEVNLSSKDKKSIVEVYKHGQAGFRALPARRKRYVFAQAYSEIRFMLESNLMRKFVATDLFKEALAADQSSHPYAQ